MISSNRSSISSHSKNLFGLFVISIVFFAENVRCRNRARNPSGLRNKKKINNRNSSAIDDRTAPLACNICQGGNSTLINGEKEFTMSNGLTWTCKYLQETVQDVDEFGLYDEARMCRHAQLQAEWGDCDCVDDGDYDDAFEELPSLMEMYVDPNGACNMCAGYGNGSIPDSKNNALVATGVMGTQNCEGLHFAMMEGILSANLCPQIQQVAGPVCCIDDLVTVGRATTPNNNQNLRGGLLIDIP